MRKHSEDTKAKIKQGNQGYGWFNDGKMEIKAKVCPEGFVSGRLSKGRWYTNGIETIYSYTFPEGKGWYIGRSKLKKDRNWYNDGKKNFLLDKVPTEEIEKGVYFYGMIKNSKGIISTPKGHSFLTKPKQPKKETQVTMGEIKPLDKPLTDSRTVDNSEEFNPEKFTLNKHYDVKLLRKTTQSQNGKLTLEQIREFCKEMD